MLPAIKDDPVNKTFQPVFYEHNLSPLFCNLFPQNSEVAAVPPV